MNDRLDDQPDHGTPDEGTDALDERSVEALRVGLRDVTMPDASVRERHLATALAAFDEMAPQAPPVVDLASRRRTVRLQQLLAAAAAIVIIAGIGIVLGVRANSGSNDDTASDSAESAVAAKSDASAEMSADDASSGGAGSGVTEYGTQGADQFDTATGQAEAPVPSSNDGVTDASPSTTVQINAATSSPLDLGEFATDAALRAAIDDLTAPPGSRQTTKTTMAMRTADPTRLTACANARPVDSFVLAAATVGSAPVLVAQSVSPDGTTQFTVIDTVDCTTRPL